LLKKDTDFSEPLDFYDPRQPRDKNGRFGSKRSIGNNIQTSPTLADLVEQNRQKIRLKLESSGDKNSIILTGGQSYGDVLKAEGKAAADQKLDQTIDKLATYKARHEQEKINSVAPASDELPEITPDPPAAKKKTKIQQRIDDQTERGKAAFDNAPDFLKRAIEKHGHPPILRPRSGKGAYFLEGSGIHMDSKPKDYYPSVYRHEWGHYADYKLGNNSYISSSPAGKKAFAADEKAFDKDLYEGAVNMVLRDVPKYGGGDSGHGWVADIAGAITKNKVGHGHSDEYFAWDENRRTEVFANVVSLVGSGNPTLKDAAGMVAPNMYKLAMKKLSE
jgi:hypothetical protein